MKKNQLTTAVLAALLFASSSVLAKSDYPAADFQPKVVFSDPSAATSKSSSPAAAEAVEADPNFPAANYQPKVLFNDSGYKHSAAAPAAPGFSASSASSKSSASASASESVAVEKPASSNTTLIGLIVLAVAGYFFYSKRSGDKGVASPVSGGGYVAATGGVTGVEKYLEKLGGDKTGVAKYLEKQTETPKTGVAKYMAKQIIRDREAAAARQTGVERYLREKG